MAVAHDVPVLKKWYLELVATLADKVQKAQRESDATTGMLSVQKSKIG